MIALERQETRRGIGLKNNIEALKAAVPIIDVADFYCGPGGLKRSGPDRWRGRCPIPDHEDDSPSFVVYAEQEPRAVGRDVGLELEDAFEVEELVKARAVGVRDVRSVSAREDKAPAGQLVGNPRRQLIQHAPASRLDRTRPTLTAVRARCGQNENKRDKHEFLAALHAPLLHRYRPSPFQ